MHPAERTLTFNWSGNDGYLWEFFHVHSEFSVKSTTKKFSHGYLLPEQSQVIVLPAGCSASHTCNRHLYVCSISMLHQRLWICFHSGSFPFMNVSVFLRSQIDTLGKIQKEQECTPVGRILPAHWLYARGCLPRRVSVCPGGAIWPIPSCIWCYLYAVPARTETQEQCSCL